MSRCLHCIAMTVLFCGVNRAAGQAPAEWVQWRGPGGSGTAAAGAYPATWSADGENLAWKLKLPGRGCSTPVVWHDDIFLTTPIDGRDGVMCVNRAGKVRWQTALGKERRGKHGNGSSACPSPATDGRLVFAYYRSGTLACLDLAGRRLWHTNLQERFGPDMLWWDIGTSPVLTDRHVVVAVMHGGESFLAAFEKQTGEPAWKEARNFKCPLEGDHAYTTPIVLTHKGREILLVWGAAHVTAHRAADGKRLWACGGFNPGSRPNWVAVASSVVAGDVAVVPYGRGEHLAGVRLGGAGDVTATHRVWEREQIGAFVPTPAFHDGNVYLLGDKGRLDCIDPETGESRWTGNLPKHRMKYYASPTIAGSTLFAVREDGVVFVADVTDGLKVLAENPMGEQIIASPVPTPNGLLLRGARHLFCVKALRY